MKDRWAWHGVGRGADTKREEVGGGEGLCALHAVTHSLDWWLRLFATRVIDAVCFHVRLKSQLLPDRRTLYTHKPPAKHGVVCGCAMCIFALYKTLPMFGSCGGHAPAQKTRQQTPYQQTRTYPPPVPTHASPSLSPPPPLHNLVFSPLNTLFSFSPIDEHNTFFTLVALSLSVCLSLSVSRSFSSFFGHGGMECPVDELYMYMYIDVHVHRSAETKAEVDYE